MNGLELNWLELYGYLGSALIAISLMMSDIRKLRWINLVGAGSFASYGLLINSWPVAILNGFIVLIDVVHLWQLSRETRVSHSVEFAADDAFVQSVLVDVWPQLLELNENQRLSVEFLGTSPLSFTVLEQTESPAETRLAA
jgi:EamA domain-containing membrane protein RarD